MKLIIGLLVVFLFYSCKKENEFAFYIWKSEAKTSPIIKRALDNTQSKKIFIHFFDVIKNKGKSEYDDGIYPSYVIQDIDTSYRKYKITPTIYITNEVFKHDINLEELANKIKDLTHQISEKHFNKQLKTLQIDCDWSVTTKDKYFKLLKLLKPNFDLSCTIRLHQIKYPDKTGVPPLSKGTLMVYNVGDISNMYANSILEKEIVKQYINASTSYPLTLDVALPLFSQTVVKSSWNTRLINKNLAKELDTLKDCEKINANLYRVNDYISRKEFYFSKGDSIKIERSNKEDIISAYKIIKESKLNTSKIIFYQLDEKCLETTTLNSILSAL